MSKNEKFNEFTLKRAKENGAKAIILTVDSPVGGYREDDIRNDFQFPLGFANLELFAKQNDDGSKTGKGAGKFAVLFGPCDGVCACFPAFVGLA